MCLHCIKKGLHAQKKLNIVLQRTRHTTKGYLWPLIVRISKYDTWIVHVWGQFPILWYLGNVELEIMVWNGDGDNGEWGTVKVGGLYHPSAVIQCYQLTNLVGTWNNAT